VADSLSLCGKKCEANMKMLFSAFLVVLCTGSLSCAQHGTAVSGYFPEKYMGDTWTGVLTAVDDDTREITLTYKNGAKTESFVGVLEKGYLAKQINGPERELKPSDLQKGTKLTVLYYTVTEKIQDKKVKVKTVFLIKGIANLRPTDAKFKAF
jgi:hypothetical protein